MKVYNYKKAKEIIERYKDKDLKYASLGMKEDWGWTAETIWSNNKYLVKLKKDTQIAGIKSSYWATPVLELDFGDHLLTVDCYTYE
jgi:hypothetical protein